MKMKSQLRQGLVRRSRTPLFLVSVIVLLLGPILVRISNQVIDTRFQTGENVLLPEGLDPVPIDCIPAIDQKVDDDVNQLVVIPNDAPPTSLRVAELFLADQAVRQIPDRLDPQKVREEDTTRRIEVLDLILDGEIRSARNLVHAAYIFQHGDCSEHYFLANQLAHLALDAGYSDARWIYAATLDRYLMSIGEQQKFGTQYTWIDGEFKLYPVDPTTTDEERAMYAVPSLDQASSQSPGGSGSVVVQQKRLKTWWLTLIGAVYAALGAVIAIVDSEINASRGKYILVIACLVYLMSIAGHYLQVMALNQGKFEIQEKMWGLVNGLMILIWCGFVAFELLRLWRKTR
jgi:hypothetical protein